MEIIHTWEVVELEAIEKLDRGFLIHPVYCYHPKLMMFFALKKWNTMINARSFPGGTMVKNPPANAGDTRDTIWSLYWDNFQE